MKIKVILHRLYYCTLHLDYLTCDLFVLIYQHTALLLNHYYHFHFLINCSMLRISMLGQSLIWVDLIFVLHLLAALVEFHC